MKTIYLLAVSLACLATQSASAGNFDHNGTSNAYTCPGVYIIYKDGEAMYVGRSRVNIQTRLKNHYAGRGSQCVDSQRAANLNAKWTFEEICATSMEQLEANMISSKGPLCNLRGEKDPAD